jgi:hypothetical protein
MSSLFKLRVNPTRGGKAVPHSELAELESLLAVLRREVDQALQLMQELNQLLAQRRSEILYRWAKPN